MKEINSKEPRFPGNVGFTTRQNSPLQATELQETSLREARSFWSMGFTTQWHHRNIGRLEMWLSILEGSLFFRSPKWRNLDHMRLGIHQMWVSRLSTIPVYRSPKFREFAHRKLSPQFTTWQYRFYRPQKCRKWSSHEVSSLWTVGFHEQKKSLFSGRQNLGNEVTGILFPLKFGFQDLA
jgi:hypothetical protein